MEAARAPSNGRDEIAIRVSDRGAGFTPLQERELFKPFFTTKPEGHGLGLAVSQNILLEHGGRIVAANRVDCPVAPCSRSRSRWCDERGTSWWWTTRP